MTQFWIGFKVWPCQQKGILYLSRLADDEKWVPSHSVWPYWGRFCDCNERGGLWQGSLKIVCLMLLFVSIIFISGVETALVSNSYIQNLNTHTPLKFWKFSHSLAGVLLIYFLLSVLFRKKFIIWKIMENASIFF